MKRQIAIPCSCAGSCTVALITECEDDDPDVFVEMYEHVQCQQRWRDRVRVAWAVVRGREPFTHGVALTGEQLAALRDFLNETTEAAA